MFNERIKCEPHGHVHVEHNHLVALGQALHLTREILPFAGFPAQGSVVVAAPGKHRAVDAESQRVQRANSKLYTAQTLHKRRLLAFQHALA